MFSARENNISGAFVGLCVFSLQLSESYYHLVTQRSTEDVQRVTEKTGKVITSKIACRTGIIYKNRYVYFLLLFRKDR